MTFPAFNVVFGSYYDALSIPVDELSLPVHFKQYAPDQDSDFNCLSVISASPALGAKQWTLNGRWITIGIYRDEGRAPAIPPALSGLTWYRSGTLLIVETGTPHRFKLGDRMTVANVNVSTMEAKVVQVPDQNNVVFETPNIGAASGSSGALQLLDPINFYETYCVFRLLPSFKLVPYSVIQSLFTSSAPTPLPPASQLYDITKAAMVKVPSATSRSTNYQVPATPVVTDQLDIRFNQAYDEQGAPLKLSYQLNGLVQPVYNVDSPFKNKQVFFQTPVDGTVDHHIHAYDFYGTPLNDTSRGPFFTDDIIGKITPAVNGVYGLTRKTNTGHIIYTGGIYDLYGNIAIGAQANNALVVRKPVLPLELDAFNRPTKKAKN